MIGGRRLAYACSKGGRSEQGSDGGERERPTPHERASRKLGPASVPIREEPQSSKWSIRFFETFASVISEGIQSGLFPGEVDSQAQAS